MFSQFFGHYLLNKGTISDEQLKKALDYQKDAYLKLGVLAINAGYMSANQVNEIHSMQSRVDKRFGELAIEKGYLKNEELDGLLASQTKEHMLLGQALVDNEFLTLHQLEKELNMYKEDYFLSEDEFESLMNGDTKVIVDTYLDFNGEDNNNFVYREYSELFLRMIIRFISKNFRIKEAEKIDELECEWLVHQHIYGEINLVTALVGNKQVFTNLASKYANEEFDHMSDLAQDSIGEFLNLCNGIFLVNMSDSGTELNMSPQVISTSKKLKSVKNTYRVPLYLLCGKIEFIISEECEIL